MNERIEECQAYQHSANQKHINAKKEAKKVNNMMCAGVSVCVVCVCVCGVHCGAVDKTLGS